MGLKPVLQAPNLTLILCSGSQHLSRPMGKPAIYIGENKVADQLRGNREADQHLCFRYLDSTVPLLLKSTLFCDCTGRFVSALVGNHIVGFPMGAAHLVSSLSIYQSLMRCDIFMQCQLYRDTRKPVFGI